MSTVVVVAVGMSMIVTVLPIVPVITTILHIALTMVSMVSMIPVIVIVEKGGFPLLSVVVVSLLDVHHRIVVIAASLNVNGPVGQQAADPIDVARIEALGARKPLAVDHLWRRHRGTKTIHCFG